MVMLKGGKNPVLAHLFLNHMLDTEVAKQNFSADRLPAAAERRSTRTRWSPTASSRRTCKRAIVRPEYFDAGYRLLELDAANDAAWHNVWRAFKAGGS